ncbi:MAG TPA: low temperature requirement protein A [Candidatus Limnocylindrales bacterium]
MTASPRPVPLKRPMSGRDPNESDRGSTPLELFYDLVFVVAVGAAAAGLHHSLSTGEVTRGILGFLVVFFSIWWPWVNFTWFASAYDTDDVVYRVLTFVQMVGILIVTAGVPAIFEGNDFRIGVIGYVVMRLALVSLWLRAALEDPAGRSTALRFAIGVGGMQVLWVIRLGIDGPLGLVLFVLFGFGELLVPVWAERSGGRPTPWNARHVTERYGGFTIIVLGECILAATTAIQAAVQDEGVSAPLLGVAFGGLLLVFGAWWAYFKHESHLAQLRGSGLSAFVWGYGHYVVFASAAALGAGLQVAADETHEVIALGPTAAAMTVAIPISIYLVAVAAIHQRETTVATRVGIGGAVVVLIGIALATPALGLSFAIPLMGVVVAGLIVLSRIRDARGEPAPEPRAAETERELAAP